MKGIMAESGLYAQMESLLLERMAEELAGSGVEFTEAEVATLATAIFSAERLQRLVEPVVDGLHTWFWSGAPRPELIIDMTELRTALPEVIRPLFIAKLEALPVCSASQVTGLDDSSAEGMPPCKSADAEVNRRVVDRAIESAPLDRLMPAQVDLATVIEQANGPEYWTEMRESFAGARIALTLIPYGWGVIALLLLLLAVLNLDRWYTPFGWFAAPMLVGGGLMLAIGALLPSLIQLGMQEALMSGEELATSALSGAELLVDGLFGAMRTLSLVTTLLGLGCMLTVIIGRRAGSGGVDRQSGVA